VAELVTNRFKDAYAVGEHGNVAVDFKQTGSGWHLKVSDEWRELPGGFDIDQSKSFGMQVVKAFVQRLNAKLAIASRPRQTVFEIFSTKKTVTVYWTGQAQRERSFDARLVVIAFWLSY
jgi:two-component sensor histidine kinase